MDILVYVLLAVIAALGAGLVALLMRRGDARAQSALADTVQRVEQSLREQERTLAALVSAATRRPARSSPTCASVWRASTRRRRRSASCRPRW